MAHTAFFAWQLDTPPDHNKKFIWEALVEATSQTNVDATPEASPRPESDATGVPGSPNIIATIFDRIRQCAFFVADLSFVGETANGKKVPNPNVTIELGYAARSIGWDRTILVLNNAHGEAKDLPFDILQHRWPIEYRITEKTKVGEKRFEKLTEALAAAIRDCEQHILSRARDMADGLDTATVDFVAQHENIDFIEMRLPAATMGETLTGLDHILAVRRLIELGALCVTNEPHIGYAWTYDGRRMIDALKSAHGQILEGMRRLRQQNEAK